jgi:hypothetical protein
LTAEEALNRVASLRSRNTEARVAAVIAESTEGAGEFEAIGTTRDTST